jgi:hypothetical protein
VPSSARERG